eukprot:1160556-Pelagomonas_calceolata.AAC.5
MHVKAMCGQATWLKTWTSREHVRTTSDSMCDSRRVHVRASSGWLCDGRHVQERKGKSYIAAHAYWGSLAEAKKCLIGRGHARDTSLPCLRWG